MDNNQPFLVVVAGIGLFIAFIIWLVGRAAEWRTQQMHTAKDLLTRHYDHLELFLRNENAPEELQHVAITFSEMCDSESQSCEFAQKFFAENFVEDAAASRTLAVYRQLQNDNPDLADVFEIALTSAFLASINRWPSAAQAAERATLRMATDARRREMARAIAVAEHYMPSLGTFAAA